MRRERQMLLFLIPALLVLVLFFLFPIALAFQLSFTDSTGLGAYDYVGTTNYTRVLTRTRYLDSFKVTLAFVAIVVVCQTLIGLFFAAFLNRFPKIRNVCRAALFMPAMMSFVIVGYVWQFILSPFNGGLNAALAALGLSSLQYEWLGDPTAALICVAFAQVWMFVGYTAAIFLAGFATIPAELEEAARLDGASEWQRFRMVQLPLLAPSFTINVMLSTIGTMKAFELPFIMTRGGPDGATRTVGLQIVETLFGDYRFGLASAISIVLLVVVLAIAFVQNHYLRRREMQF